jgi:hypothetical protein
MDVMKQIERLRKKAIKNLLAQRDKVENQLIDLGHDLEAKHAKARRGRAVRSKNAKRGKPGRAPKVKAQTKPGKARRLKAETRAAG